MAELLMQYAKQAVGVAILAYAAWLYWPNVKGWLGAIKLPSLGGKTEAPVDDAAMLAAFKLLRKRVAKSPEATKALDAVWASLCPTGGDS